MADNAAPPIGGSGTVTPDGGLTLTEVLHNLALNMGSVEYLVRALMFIIGMFFIYQGLYKLKQYGEQRSMMSHHAELKGPILFLVIGAALMYYPTLINVSLQTVYNTTNILGYPKVNIINQNKQLVTDIGMILKVIGYIAFLRGWVYLTRLGGQSAQPGTLSKALTHIIGGILLINAFATWDIISNTLGFNYINT